jgi:glycyl-tRNA synthetase beta subunit
MRLSASIKLFEFSFCTKSLSLNIFLIRLSASKPAVDDFFNNVRVLDDDVELRKDRITLLWAIMISFSSIAKFSYLSK